jgi:hypothetical protein
MKKLKINMKIKKYYINNIILIIKKINLLYIKYFLRWIKSFKSNSVDDQSPWIVFEVIDFLDKWLNEEKMVFEWGSGGSTLYFSSKVKKIFSIEHNSEWFNRINLIIQNKKIKNVDYRLLEPVIGNNVDKIYLSSDDNYKEKNFLNYCKAINKFPNNYFDLIVIDGRARDGCIKESLLKIKEEGIIILDNSDRKEYRYGIELLIKSGFNKKEYFGPIPYAKMFCQTTIFQKLKNSNSSKI